MMMLLLLVQPILFSAFRGLDNGANYNYGSIKISFTKNISLRNYPEINVLPEKIVPSPESYRVIDTENVRNKNVITGVIFEKIVEGAWKTNIIRKKN